MLAKPLVFFGYVYEKQEYTLIKCFAGLNARKEFILAHAQLLGVHPFIYFNGKMSAVSSPSRSMEVLMMVIFNTIVGGSFETRTTTDLLYHCESSNEKLERHCRIISAYICTVYMHCTGYPDF